MRMVSAAAARALAQKAGDLAGVGQGFEVFDRRGNKFAVLVRHGKRGTDGHDPLAARPLSMLEEMSDYIADLAEKNLGGSTMPVRS